jgi:hypothetical protein
VRSVVVPLETRIKELEARELPEPDLAAIAALVPAPVAVDGKDGVAPTLDEVLAALIPHRG